MPRDSAGNYTLPSGNPVVGGTTIATSWGNPTMADIGNELTNSLDRSGRGGMLAPFKFADGTLPAPGMTWNAEPTSGFYRAAGNDMEAVIAGVPRQRWTANSVDVWDTGTSAWVSIVGPGGSNFAFTTNPNTYTKQNTFTSNRAAPLQYAVLLSAANAALGFNETDAATDAKRWMLATDATQFIGSIANDADTTSKAWLQVNRTAFAVTGMLFGNATDNPPYQFLGTGTGAVNGPWTFNGVATQTALVVNYASGTGGPLETVFRTSVPAGQSQRWRMNQSGTVNWDWCCEATTGIFRLRVSDTTDVLTIQPASIVFGTSSYSFLGTGASTVAGTWTWNNSAAGQIVIAPPTGATPMMIFRANGGASGDAYFGTAGASNAIINGLGAGDMGLRVPAGKGMAFSVDGGVGYKLAIGTDINAAPGLNNWFIVKSARMQLVADTTPTGAYLYFGDNNSADAYIGRAGSANDLNNGSVRGELMLRTQGVNVSISNNSGVTRQFVFGSSGDATCVGLITASQFNTFSSRTIKRETGKPTGAAYILSRLRPILFRLLDKDRDQSEQLGLISEEVHELCPWLSDGKSVAYDRLALLLLCDWQRAHCAGAV